MTTDGGKWQGAGLAWALTAFAVTRAVIWAAACTAPQDRGRPQSPREWSHVPTIRWDAGHYARILKTGYPLENGGLPSGAGVEVLAFFPLYPLTARLAAVWIEPEAALVVTTHLASAAAMVFLYLWARRRYNPRVAFWSVLVLSVYPPAMFLSTGYADGLLLLWVALAVWLLENGRLWPAALVSGLATATRPTGLALAAVLLLWAVQHRPRLAWPAQAARLAAIGLVSISGLIGYQLYLWRHYQRPDAFLVAQARWSGPKDRPDALLRILVLAPVTERAVAPVKYLFRGDWDRLREPGRWNALWNVAIVSLAVAGLIRARPVPRVFFLLPVFIFLEGWLPDPAGGARLIGIARYQLVALPSFLLLAAWMVHRWPTWLRGGFCAACLAMQCLYVRHFVNWELVG
ncbi:MAG: glycosyltransferase family 39 protein [Phycisphaerae bacterium]